MSEGGMSNGICHCLGVPWRVLVHSRETADTPKTAEVSAHGKRKGSDYRRQSC
jgi:hypothetical protein